MNSEDADHLAHKITATWPGGPKPQIWAEELEELHANQAHEAYRRLRKSEDKAPSIHTFLAIYNSLTVHDDTKVDCPACDGGGWVDQSPVVHHRQCAGEDRCHCRAVLPCHCAAGRQRQASYNRIVGKGDKP